VNDPMKDFARRAVACTNWRWMPGMLVMSDPERVPRVIGSPVWPSELRARVTSEVLGRWHGVGQYCVDYPDSEHETMSGDDLPGTLPDLTDSATIGCVVALVREIYPDATTQIDSGSWWVAARNGYRVSSGQTEAEALVAALKVNDATESG